MAIADAPAEVDGRRLRREQNRDAVLDALGALFHEGSYQPSTNEIAERGGISPRSLFRYFDDVDDLNRAAIDLQLAKARPLLDVGRATRYCDPHQDRTHGRSARPLVRDHRARRSRWPGSAHTATQLSRRRSPKAARTSAANSEGCSHPSCASRAAVFPAVDALCAFETYELLRHDQGLSRPKTVEALVDALAALLDA